MIKVCEVSKEIHNAIHS